MMEVASRAAEAGPAALFRQQHGWTIQVSYSTTDDDGRKFMARSAFWSDADTLLGAYAQASAAFSARPDVKLGAIIPGRHAGGF